MTGAASSMLSKRSSRPPCPGMAVPESFTMSVRLISDSIKSPKVPKMTIILDIKKFMDMFMIWQQQCKAEFRVMLDYFQTL